MSSAVHRTRIADVLTATTATARATIGARSTRSRTFGVDTPTPRERARLPLPVVGCAAGAEAVAGDDGPVVSPDGSESVTDPGGSVDGVHLRADGAAGVEVGGVYGLGAVCGVIRSVGTTGLGRKQPVDHSVELGAGYLTGGVAFA